MNATYLPYGARLATALAGSDGEDLWHVADFAILDRKAFVPAFFATPGQSTVRLKQPFAAIGAVNADDGGSITVSEVKTLLSGNYDGLDDYSRFRLRPYKTLACDFDYLAILGAPPQISPLTSSRSRHGLAPRSIVLCRGVSASACHEKWRTKARKHKFRCRWAPAKSYAKIAPEAHFGTRAQTSSAVSAKKKPGSPARGMRYKRRRTRRYRMVEDGRPALPPKFNSSMWPAIPGPIDVFSEQ